MIKFNQKVLLKSYIDINTKLKSEKHNAFIEEIIKFK